MEAIGKTTWLSVRPGWLSVLWRTDALRAQIDPEVCQVMVRRLLPCQCYSCRPMELCGLLQYGTLKLKSADLRAGSHAVFSELADHQSGKYRKIVKV